MNVLLIAIDTLRADHLSCYGYERLTSPHLDALAAKGIRFAQHISPHIPTHPGYTTIFTGQDAFRHQIVTQGGKIELAEDVLTLPQLLKQQGFFTAAVDNMGRWFMRGFDLYERAHWEQPAGGPWRKAEAVNEKAFGVLAACEAQERPWFCFLHYWDPHTPYLPPPPFDRMFYVGEETDSRHQSAYEMMHNYPAFMYYFQEWMPGLTDIEFPKAQYDAEIAYVDTALVHIFSRLRQMRGGEDTLIVVTADHGEELDEHQIYFDHHGLYETNLHVPLILYHPERAAGGIVYEELSSHLDLTPTILDFLGLAEIAEAAEMQGQSLLRALENRAETNSGWRAAGRAEQDVRAAEQEDVQGGVYITECAWMKKRGFRTPRYKYIESLYDELHRRPPFELYDLRADPLEQHNLVEERRDLLGAFQQRMQEHIARRLAATGLPDPLSYQEITLTRVGRPKEEQETAAEKEIAPGG